MSEADREVRRILEYLEERIDLEHVARAQARQQAALDFADLDRPPLVFYLPYEGREFTPYPYPEAFADPAKMMVNELLIGFTSLYHAVDLRDDAPYCLRPNLGTVLIASMLGAEIRMLENNMPWAVPSGDSERIRAIVQSPLPDVRAGLGQRVLDQYDYYDEAVSRYPRCKQALNWTLPDLQGPFSIAELLWGPRIYTAFYDEPDLIVQLLAKVTAQILMAYRAFRTRTTDSSRDGYSHQHAVAVKCKLLIRNDSMVNISPRMYRDIVRPFDEQLAQALSSVGVHFCGNGMHQVENLLQIRELTCLDIGQPDKMDLDKLYTQAASRRVALARLTVPEAELNAAQLKRRFPRGVNFVYTATSVSQAHVLLRQSQESAAIHHTVAKSKT